MGRCYKQTMSDQSKINHKVENELLSPETTSLPRLGFASGQYYAGK